MTTHSSVTFVVLAAVCVAAVGCGGSSKPRLTKAEFVKRGNAICAKGTRKIDHAGLTFVRTPGHPSAQETITFAEKVAVPTVQSELDQLRTLRPPADDEPTIEKLLDKTQAAVNRVRENPSLLGRSNGSVEANALARAYGLTACAV